MTRRRSALARPSLKSPQTATIKEESKKQKKHGWDVDKVCSISAVGGDSSELGGVAYGWSQFSSEAIFDPGNAPILGLLVSDVVRNGTTFRSGRPLIPQGSRVAVIDPTVR